ncbi:hypothetical protein DIPPA_06841 [Diplonema papillatum]|nr:hypothetical protein DIPPA_06841 [Diplonema papillatum]
MGNSESKPSPEEQVAAQSLSKMRTAQGREACYQAKDDYYKCLESGTADCSKEIEGYETTCPRSWRNYFSDGKKKETIVLTQLQNRL